jgi:hypothetical protein
MAPIPLQTRLAPKIAKLQNIFTVLRILHDLPSELAEDEFGQLILEFARWVFIYYPVLLLLVLGCLWALVRGGIAVWRRWVVQDENGERAGKDDERPGMKEVVSVAEASERTVME